MPQNCRRQTGTGTGGAEAATAAAGAEAETVAAEAAAQHELIKASKTLSRGGVKWCVSVFVCVWRGLARAALH